MIRGVRWICLDSCGTQISSFLPSSRHLIWFSIVVYDTFNYFLQFIAQLYEASIRFNYGFHYVIINFTRLIRPLVTFQWEISRMKFLKQILTRAFRQIINTINFTYLFASLGRFLALIIKNSTVSKILILALHVKTNRKLTIVNKITRNLFLYQPKGIHYQISKYKNSNIDERITKQT